jgi:hypothetical protein
MRALFWCVAGYCDRRAACWRRLYNNKNQGNIATVSLQNTYRRMPSRRPAKIFINFKSIREGQNIYQLASAFFFSIRAFT